MKFTKLFLTSLCLLAAQVVFAGERLPATTPIGLWKTIDDVTGQAKSIVQISAENNGALSGSVVKLFKDPDKRCTTCEGVKQNQPVLGIAAQ